MKKYYGTSVKWFQSKPSMPYEQELGQSEMDCLLAQWEELDSPMVSIKDLPLLVEFSQQELEKRLRR